MSFAEELRRDIENEGYDVFVELDYSPLPKYTKDRTVSFNGRVVSKAFPSGHRIPDQIRLTLGSANLVKFTVTGGPRGAAFKLYSGKPIQIIDLAGDEQIQKDIIEIAGRRGYEVKQYVKCKMS